MRVIALDPDNSRLPVAWYIVAEPEKVHAESAVRDSIDFACARVEGMYAVTPIFKGRPLSPGEVVFLYRRGLPREMLKSVV